MPEKQGKVFHRNVLVHEGVVALNQGDATDSGQAATLHKPSGNITSSTNNLGAKTTEQLTITNRYCKADSIILNSIQGGGAGDVVVSRVVPAAGSFTVDILNADPTNACNAVYIFSFVIVGKSA